MPQSGIVKYHVKLSYEVDGLVERADIIGAIFGQTEGLLGPEMNLNELQRVSKVGRIEVIAKSTSNTTSGNAVIPMSTDIDTCALIAAGIESIDKVGPFDCKFTLDAIDDVRAAKKDDIVRRAKEIKQKWATKTVSEGETMLNDVHQGDSGKLSTYGPSKLTCSSGVFNSKWIILVEGRADVINLLRAGYDNVLAIEGAKIDESIKELCSEKDTVVAFIDGDRAGGFILKELKSVVTLDYELQADTGVEVEELTPQRLDEILQPIADEIKELCSEKDTVVAFIDGDRAGGFILKELKSVVTLDYELQADTGVEVEELTPQRLSEILEPIADEIKNGKPAPKLNSEDDNLLQM
jgi:DNA primase